MLVQSTALFDTAVEANRLVDALRKEGFETIVVDADFTRVPDADELHAEDLVLLGVASRQAAQFADQIRAGATLVVVSCDERRIAPLRETMAHFGLRAAPQLPASGHLMFSHTTGDEDRQPGSIDEGGIHRNEHVERQFRRADSERLIGDHDTGDATGLSRRAHADPTAPGPDTESTSSLEGPRVVGDTPLILDRFEESFRHHYEQNFADTELPFSHYARAYHFGVVLAEHRGFNNQNWTEIEPFARDGWTSQIHGDWSAVKHAVEYGWHTVRGRDTTAGAGL